MIWESPMVLFSYKSQPKRSGVWNSKNSRFHRFRSVLRCGHHIQSVYWTYDPYVSRMSTPEAYNNGYMINILFGLRMSTSETKIINHSSSQRTIQHVACMFNIWSVCFFRMSSLEIWNFQLPVISETLYRSDMRSASSMCGTHPRRILA